jgi:hypothetical protein
MTLRLLVALCLLVLLAPATADAKQLGCRSGQTKFQDARTRIIRTHVGRWYICSTEMRHPHLFAGETGRRIDSLHAFRRFGDRVAFAWSETTSDEGGWLAAWVDLRTAEVRSTGMPAGTDRLQAVAVDPDGAIAFVALDDDGHGQQIGYARNGVHALGSARLLTGVTAGDVVPGSLALANGMVTWTTTSGRLGSAPIVT